tara:strand:+ start:147 stop:800 length:654 start_codon:yes stop_codon:yes gene_type:complete
MEFFGIELSSLFTGIYDLSFRIFSSTLIGILSHYIAVGSGETFLETKHSKLTFYLLPPIATSITFAISGDIALSLGMVGALSIIRFRTPVRNPFELVIYFYLITIGITSAVSVAISVLLFVTLTIILFLNVFISKTKNVSEINGTFNQLTILSLEEFKYSEFKNDLKLIYLQVNAEKKFEYSFFVLNEDFEQIIKNIRQYVGDNLIELSFASSIDDA